MLIKKLYWHYNFTRIIAYIYWLFELWKIINFIKKRYVILVTDYNRINTLIKIVKMLKTFLF